MLYISIKLPIHVHPKELQRYRAGFEPASLFLNLYVYIITQNFNFFKLFHLKNFQVFCGFQGILVESHNHKENINLSCPMAA